MGSGVIPGVGRVYIKLSGLSMQTFLSLDFWSTTTGPTMETRPTMAFYMCVSGGKRHVGKKSWCKHGQGCELQEFECDSGGVYGGPFSRSTGCRTVHMYTVLRTR